MTDRRRDYTPAGPVKVRKRDGSVEELTAYSTAEFYAVVANRHDKKVNKVKQRRNGT